MKLFTVLTEKLAFLTLLVLVCVPQVATAASDLPEVYLFGREDCGYCKAEREFLADAGVPYVYFDVVTDATAKELFARLTSKHELTKVTPVTVVGASVFQGFNGPETTGAAIIAAATAPSPYRSIEDHLREAPKASVTTGSGCDENGVECAAADASYVFDLPLLGLVDLKTLSLFTLSLMLGTIDGFNPCAMWVLVTFLVLLTQAGSRQKMILLAGIFIAAEAVMYNLILNVWYKTWDFVALDQVVTPLVGLLAMGGGAFFLYRWHRNRGLSLVCDIQSLDAQAKTINRFKQIVAAPLTLTTLGAVLLIAFSVNVIEFACSIGIPQAYTKILELNALSFIERQWYILVYTAGYMVDDLVVFGLAIWGFSKLEAHGHRYTQLSLLIGGALMLLLGALLTFAPTLLVL